MSSTVDICPLSDLPPGEYRVVEIDDYEVAVVNCEGELFALEDRCSHDDALLFEGGEIDAATRSIECPRHGSRFDLRTGRPLNLPAYEPIDTFAVSIDGGMIRVEVD